MYLFIFFFIQMTEYHLPVVDAVYRNQHLTDVPTMLYPGEIKSEEISHGRYKYIITNYGRIYNINRKCFISQIAGVVTSTYLKQHFTSEQLDNEYTRENLRNTPDKIRYRANREQRIARQKEYNKLHREAKREYDKQRYQRIKQQQATEAAAAEIVAEQTTN